MAERIGGFFADLNLLTNETSFRKGISNLRGVGKELGNLFKWGAAISGLTGIFTGAMALMQAKQLLVAKESNLTTNELNSWTNAVDAAGLSGESFVSSLADMDARIQQIKIGGSDIGDVAKDVGLLGLNFANFMKEGSDARAQNILKAALGMKDERKAAQLVANLLGKAGEDYFWWLKSRGASLGQELEKGLARSFMTEPMRKKAQAFSYELSSLMSSGREGINLFSTEFASTFTPVLAELNKWFQDNHELISSTIIGWADDLGRFAAKVITLVEEWLPKIIAFVEKSGGVGQLLKDIAIGFAAWEGIKIAAGIGSLLTGLAGLAPVLGPMALIVGGLAAIAGLFYLGAETAKKLPTPGEGTSYLDNIVRLAQGKDAGGIGPGAEISKTFFNAKAAAAALSDPFANDAMAQRMNSLVAAMGGRPTSGIGLQLTIVDKTRGGISAGGAIQDGGANIQQRAQ